MESFTMTGTIRDTVREITWTDGVFDDPTGEVDHLIRSGAVVSATITGPSFPAAAHPPAVAILTAAAAFDPHTGKIYKGTEWAESVMIAAMDEWMAGNPPNTVY